ncbi:MAG: hypothetical protein ACK4G5_14980 [Devosia sp.]|jgi:hypothetical protein|nr:hypothetical protein [Alphaproteobacteria bacterium]MBU1560500.1 hypothetical protein [Alphaproteobacteria bacterium]MBU2301326.1 hypothetical protein [Alphaproteobacteria bacterium]MBU2366771.1 hypothetical protein [Alphaproteobacteria bacterium]
MRRIALIAALTVLSAAPAMAQNFVGNWACRDATTAKAGILTIYGEVYGFASTVVGDASSGTGTITVYQDGVGFNDGGLKTARNMTAGRVIPDPTYGTAIQLETAEAIVMLCTPR